MANASLKTSDRRLGGAGALSQVALGETSPPPGFAHQVVPSHGQSIALMHYCDNAMSSGNGRRETGGMAVQLNHTIAHAHDAQVSADFLSEMLGVSPPTRFGPFLVVEVDNGVSIDFLEVDDDYEIEVQHYAFLVSEDEFDQIFGRIQERALPHFADPHRNEPGRINTQDGGRGVYWADPSGNILEIITRPYGGWPS